MEIDVPKKYATGNRSKAAFRLDCIAAHVTSAPEPVSPRHPQVPNVQTNTQAQPTDPTTLTTPFWSTIELQAVLTQSSANVTVPSLQVY
jgi:hypothetical protein